MLCHHPHPQAVSPSSPGIFQTKKVSIVALCSSHLILHKPEACCYSQRDNQLLWGQSNFIQPPTLSQLSTYSAVLKTQFCLTQLHLKWVMRENIHCTLLQLKMLHVEHFLNYIITDNDRTATSLFFSHLGCSKHFLSISEPCANYSFFCNVAHT